MASVALLGFPHDLACQLALALAAGSHVVHHRQDTRGLRHDAASVVFICGDGPAFREILSAVKKRDPGMPVVVATRMPDSKQWLDALEAGASDYCGAPFEAVQLRWIMDSVLGAHARHAA